MAHVTNSNLYSIDAGTSDFSGACVVLVRTEWNASIVDELERGARSVLEQYGVKLVETIAVPGAVEIPFAIRARFQSSSFLKADAFVALGCVIRGDTPHFDYVCQSVTDGITQLNLNLTAPVIMGILTVENQQQAEDRIGGCHGHKGEEAALTALKMIALNRYFNK